MSGTGYVCHNCGHGLIATPKERYPLACLHCRKPRKVPTHPALMAPWRRAERFPERQGVA